MDDLNPYALSQVELEPPAEPGALVPAAPSQRIFATLIDWALYAAVFGASLAILEADAGTAEGLNEALALAPWLLGGFAYLALLLRRGQSPGKVLLGIRVADLRTGRVPPGYKLLLFRAAPLWVLSCFAPMLIVVELVMLLLPEGRTICDYIAGTRVVQGQPAGTAPASV